MTRFILSWKILSQLPFFLKNWNQSTLLKCLPVAFLRKIALAAGLYLAFFSFSWAFRPVPSVPSPPSVPKVRSVPSFSSFKRAPRAPIAPISTKVRFAPRAPLPKSVTLVKRPPLAKRPKPVRMVPLVKRVPTVRRAPFVRAVPKRRSTFFRFIASLAGSFLEVAFS